MHDRFGLVTARLVGLHPLGLPLPPVGALGCLTPAFFRGIGYLNRAPRFLVLLPILPPWPVLSPCPETPQCAGLPA